MLGNAHGARLSLRNLHHAILTKHGASVQQQLDEANQALAQVRGAEKI